MKATNKTTTAGAQSIPETKRKEQLSHDGKWKSFPATRKDGTGGKPNLLQYVNTGTYYARCKVNGKPVRASLGTDVWSTAILLLPDKLKELRAPKAAVGTFAGGCLKYESESSHGYNSKKNKFVKLAPLSAAYRLRCLENLRRSLVETLFHPGKGWKDLSEQTRADALKRLDAMNAREFTKDICESWQAGYSEYSPIVFNNTLNTFRRVLELAGLPHDSNPAYKIGRMDIVEKQVELPSPEQFDRIIELVETSNGSKLSGARKTQANDCANLIRFLSFTGARISEAKKAIWSDVNWRENTLQIHSVKVRGGHDLDVTRTIAFNPSLKQLLERMRFEQNPSSTDRICKVSECQKSLDSACSSIGCKRITHHDLRHYFITKCLQAGVDVFTLAKWVGHRDNGKLLLKVYIHFQAAHAHKMASNVVFGASPLPANTIPMPNQKTW